MILAEVGRTGQVVDVTAGGDVGPDGRLLSVAELQQALRAARHGAPGPAAVEGEVRPGSPVSPPAGRPVTPAGAPSAEAAAGGLLVVAAHSGAGASTVALAVADAAGLAGRPVRLVSTAPVGRCGLAAVAAAELGIDPSGCWRRGTRGTVTVDRRHADAAADGPLSDGRLLVWDVGTDRRPSDAGRLLVVCRPTVPGVRAAEQLLEESGSAAAAVAVVGAGRWPGPVRSSVGPRLAACRAAGRVVDVPVDRRLQATGLTAAPLPKAVLAAGRALLMLTDPAAPTAMTRRGTTC